MSSESSLSIVKHPIQLLNVWVRELYIRVKPGISFQDLPDGDFKLGVAPGKYNEENQVISVGVKAMIGPQSDPEIEVVTEQTEPTPFSLRVELVGEFKVDEAEFPREHIADWAERGAMFVLYPYLREHVFALAARASANTILLPLLEVPTYSVERGE